ncbi:MAG: hypothetical protein NPIRA03_39650 [Nitrospirales bacterium]|nr:MAG: hypothetical protein NPIRA03_39650 [Nitrospirales bacterium]
MRKSGCVHFLFVAFPEGVRGHQRIWFWSVLFVCSWCGLYGRDAGAQISESEPIRAIQQNIQALESHDRLQADPKRLTQLAGWYLELGGLSRESKEQRISYYEHGARLAKEALVQEETLADAHFYYAANLGRAAELNGVMASALTVQELKLHATRAVELQEDHAPALHMLGRMLEELPWFLGGDEDAALQYLQKAVLADAHDDHARLDLAKLYVKRKNMTAAKKELQKIVQRTPSEQDWNWEFRYHPEAEKMLEELADNPRVSAESH